MKTVHACMKGARKKELQSTLANAGLSRKQLFKNKVTHFSMWICYWFQSSMLKTDMKQA